MLGELKKLGVRDEDIGVVTPYNAQATMIRRTLRDLSKEGIKSK